MIMRSHFAPYVSVLFALLIPVSMSSGQSVTTTRLTFGSGGMSGLTVNTLAESATGAVTIRVDLPVSDATGTIAIIRNYRVVGTGTVANGYATVSFPALSEKEVTVYPGRAADTSLTAVYCGDHNYNTATALVGQAASSSAVAHVSTELLSLQVDEKSYGKATFMRTRVLLNRTTRGVVLFFHGDKFIGSSTVLAAHAEIIRAEAATTAVLVETADDLTGKGR